MTLRPVRADLGKSCRGDGGEDTALLGAGTYPQAVHCPCQGNTALWGRAGRL